jgi:hypothetical protein
MLLGEKERHAIRGGFVGTDEFADLSQTMDRGTNRNGNKFHIKTSCLRPFSTTTNPAYPGFPPFDTHNNVKQNIVTDAIQTYTLYAFYSTGG